MNINENVIALYIYKKSQRKEIEKKEKKSKK